jgi:predicted dehydrogenase
MMTIKVGIIGCGGIANGKHMPSLQKVENVEMIAFCDVDTCHSQYHHTQ